MRNWNLDETKFFLIFIIVLILPMRNWNSDAAKHQKICEQCFDLTYEELKRIQESFHDGFHRVLILPMRNWNIFGHGNQIHNLVSFDLTYEELKHFKLA